MRHHDDTPSPADPPSGAARRHWPTALRRGFALRCPSCGRGRLMTGYLRVTERCRRCGEPFHHIKADDGPAYFTVLVVAHLVVPLVLTGEQMLAPPLWLQAVVWLPTTLILTLVLLRRFKGAVVGQMWAHHLSGTETPGHELGDGKAPADRSTDGSHGAADERPSRGLR